MEQTKIISNRRSHAINLPNNKFAIERDLGFSIYDIDDDYKCFDIIVGDEEEIYIECLIYKEKDNLLLTGCVGVIKIWDANNFECVTTIDAHGRYNYVNSLVLLPNGYFASASFDKKIKIWDMNGYVCVNTLKVKDHYIEEDCLFYLKDGRLVTLLVSEIIIWDY
jgi:WD40 repeat protein